MFQRVTVRLVALCFVIFAVGARRHHHHNGTINSISKIDNIIIDRNLAKNVLTIRRPLSAVPIADDTLPLMSNNNYNFASCEKMKIDRKDIKCKPREKVVHLVHTENAILTPSVVLVKQCEGMCNMHSKCLPTKNTTRQFTIRVYEKQEFRCYNISVREDLACKCTCPERSSDCTTKQIYDEEDCKCKCPENVNEECDSKVKGLFFDSKECKCRCKLKKNCTTGTKWDEDKCRCMKHKLVRRLRSKS